MFVKKSVDLQSTVMCWGADCQGNFSASVGTKANLVPPSQCRCRYLEELRAFFGHPATAHPNVAELPSEEPQRNCSELKATSAD
jgi:hypothetical protein